MLKIKYVPVENCEAEWGDKMALIKKNIQKIEEI